MKRFLEVLLVVFVFSVPMVLADGGSVDQSTQGIIVGSGMVIYGRSDTAGMYNTAPRVGGHANVGGCVDLTGVVKPGQQSVTGHNAGQAVAQTYRVDPKVTGSGVLESSNGVQSGPFEGAGYTVGKAQFEAAGPNYAAGKFHGNTSNTITHDAGSMNVRANTRKHVDSNSW